MIVYWLYELSTLQVTALVVTVFNGVTWLGLIFVRPFLRLLLLRQNGANDFVGHFLSYFSVIYGLLLGLLAVATYQNKTDVEKTVSREAVAVAALYRDVSAYPEPYRIPLQRAVANYTRAVIDQDWPTQRSGRIPTASTRLVDPLQDLIVAFEPATKGQEILHAEAYRQFNALIESRRTRLMSVQTGIPAMMWYVVGVGAVISMILIWVFEARLRTLFFLGGVVSFFTATMISLIVVMDNPFRGGELSASADAFESIWRSLMR